MSTRRHFHSQLTTIRKRGGDDEGAAGHGERNKQARPLIAVVEAVIDAWGVESNHPEEKHETEGGGSEAAEYFESNARAGDDKARAGEVDPSEMEWKTRGNQRGEVGRVLKMLPAE